MRRPGKRSKGLVDTAETVRQQLDPAVRRELDRARRVVYTLRQNAALIEFDAQLKQRERARRPRKQRLMVETYRSFESRARSRKELASLCGFKSTQALRDFERRSGIVPKKIGK